MTEVTHRMDAGSLVFEVRVAPRSSRTEILGAYDGALKVALTAPPVEGAANAALIEILARHFGVAKSAVRILRGARGKNKTVAIDGGDPGKLLHPS